MGNGQSFIFKCHWVLDAVGTASILIQLLIGISSWMSNKTIEMTQPYIIKIDTILKCCIYHTATRHVRIMYGKLQRPLVVTSTLTVPPWAWQLSNSENQSKTSILNTWLTYWLFPKVFSATHHHFVKPDAFRGTFEPIGLRDLQEKSVPLKGPQYTHGSTAKQIRLIFWTRLTTDLYIKHSKLIFICDSHNYTIITLIIAKKGRMPLNGFCYSYIPVFILIN